MSGRCSTSSGIDRLLKLRVGFGFGGAVGAEGPFLEVDPFDSVGRCHDTPVVLAMSEFERVA